MSTEHVPKQGASPAASPMPSGPVMRSAAPPALQMLSAEEPASETASGSEEVLMAASSPTSSDASFQLSAAPIQRNPDPTVFVRRTVTIKKRMGQVEFRQVAMQTLFGGPLDNVKWSNSREWYEPGTHTIKVDIQLIQRHRSQNNANRGMDVDEEGKIKGADERAAQQLGGNPTKTKRELVDEINRRYARDTGQGAKKPAASDQGGRAYWNQIRDEVLFQNEYIRNLPEKVKKLIRVSTDGRKITPADIEQLFNIAKKIEGLDPAEINDYYSKVTGTTTDLDVFQQSVEKYVREREERKKQNEDRENIQRDLYGKDQVYQQYKDWKGASGVAKATKEPALIAALKPEFNSIAEFEAHIAKFQAHFEREALAITLDMLSKYAGFLFQQGERYQDQTVVDGLHQQLGGFRGHYQDFKKNADISNARAAYDRRPGSIATKGSPPSTQAQAQEAYQKAHTAKQAAVGEVQGLSGAHPLLQEDFLPVDRRIDKEKMAQSNPQQLSGLIKAHISTRMEDIREAKGHLGDDPELVYKMDKMMPAYYDQMGIAKGSIFDQVVQDKISDIERSELIVNICLAVLAIALAIVSYGAATPLIAGGAAVGGLGLSSYMAYDEYNKYVTQNDLADVGLADDPSMFWLVIAVAAAALDMAAAVKAIKALTPAAKAFNASGDFGEYVKAVRSLTDAGEIEAKIAQAAEKAASARTAGKEASEALANILQTKGAVRGFTDPDIYRELVRLAGSKIKEGVQSFHHFVLGIKKARRIAGIAGDLTPDEMAKAKEAWEQAVKLHKSAEAPIDIMSTGGKKIGEFSEGNHLIIKSKSTNLHAGNTIRLAPDRTTTITGVLGDTNAVGTRGAQMPGVTLQGANPGGVNILRSPKWPQIQAKHKHILDAGDSKLYWQKVTDEFWETANKPWLEEAIKRGDNIRFVSDPADTSKLFVTDKKTGEFILDNANNPIRSIFGREVDLLKARGYTFTNDGLAVAPK